jgi:hypothetical protein
VAVSQGRLVDIDGLRQVNAALRQVAPDLRRQMFREIGGMIKARVSAAKTKSPYRRKRYPGQQGNAHLRTATYLTTAGSKRDVSGGGKQGLFGFKAISAAPHASIMALADNGGPVARGLAAKYGPAPRFLAGEMLPSGQGGTQMWRESKQIVERYIDLLNKRIESQAGGA